MRADSFVIAIPKYSGPFDLLLSAIKDEKLGIFDVSISGITSSYFEYLKKLEEIDLNSASEFLLLAALLIEMKARNVLPKPEDVSLKIEEEEIQGDLIKHLEEYKLYKFLATNLKEKKDSFRKVYSRYHREVIGHDEKKDIFLKDVNLFDLVSAFKRVWDSIPYEDQAHPIQDDDVTLPKRIEEVEKLVLESKDGLVFEALFIRKTRLEVVVTFLAVLELAKNGKIKIAQGDKFSGIRIYQRKKNN